MQKAHGNREIQEIECEVRCRRADRAKGLGRHDHRRNDQQRRYHVGEHGPGRPAMAQGQGGRHVDEGVQGVGGDEDGGQARRSFGQQVVPRPHIDEGMGVEDGHRRGRQGDHRHRLAGLVVGRRDPGRIARSDIGSEARRDGLEHRRGEHRERRAEREGEGVVAELAERQHPGEDELVGLRHHDREQVGQEHAAREAPDLEQRRRRTGDSRTAWEIAMQAHAEDGEFEHADGELPGEELHDARRAQHQKENRTDGAQRACDDRERGQPDLPLQALDRGAVELGSPADHDAQAEQPERVDDRFVRQGRRMEPVAGQPGSQEPEREADRRAERRVEPLRRGQQVADRGRFDLQCREARHFPGQRHAEAEIENDDPGLQTDEEADQSVGFDPEVADVQRNEREAHQDHPALADEAGGDVSLQRHRRMGPGAMGEFNAWRSHRRSTRNPWPRQVRSAGPSLGDCRVCPVE